MIMCTCAVEAVHAMLTRSVSAVVYGLLTTTNPTIDSSNSSSSTVTRGSAVVNCMLWEPQVCVCVCVLVVAPACTRAMHTYVTLCNTRFKHCDSLGKQLDCLLLVFAVCSNGSSNPKGCG